MHRCFAVIFALACALPVFAPTLFAQSKVPYGNPRDPLNLRFAGEKAPIGDPYREFANDAPWNDVYFLTKQQGWAVGDHGAIFVTKNGGTDWQLQETPIDATLHSVQFFDESFGIAAGGYWFPFTKQGRCVLLFTHDGGKTWRLNNTPDLPPIDKVKIVDATHIILTSSTADGTSEFFSNDSGRTWKRGANDKRQNEIRTPPPIRTKKLPLLGLFGEPEDVPLEAFAALCADQGYLGGCILLFRNNNVHNKEALFHEAFIRTGGTLTANLGIPLLRKELRTTAENLTEHIHKAADGKGLEQLRERLVAAIRQYKPEVVLTSNYTNPQTDSPVEEIVLREVMEAVKNAADPKMYRELGLDPWQVKKVYLTLKNGALGDVHLTVSEPTVRFGLSLDEMTYISRGLIETKKQKNSIIGFAEANLQNKKIFPLGTSKGFFAEIPILPGEEGRRHLLGSYAEFQAENRHRALQQRNVLGILRNAKGNLVSHAAELTRKLDPDAAVQILLETAEQFHADGDGTSATEMYQHIAKQYGKHPVARQTFSRLMQYASSEEIIQHFFPAGHDNARRDARQRTNPLHLDLFLKQNVAGIADEAVHLFMTASVLRRRHHQGGVDEAAKFYQAYSKRGDGVWEQRAKAEYRLLVPDKTKTDSVPLPLPAFVCTYTPNKPVLDGKFDEENDPDVWNRSPLYTLTSKDSRQTDSQNFGTQAMFLYDNDFLYIALRCPKVAGFAYPPAAAKQRQRNAAQQDQDRIEMLIDTDRDYSTYYSFTMDSRGWVSAKCCGSEHWHPDWHVARHEDKEAWYIEAAIPLSVFCHEGITPPLAWGIALRRLVPGIGIECWNAENSFDLTEGFGLLVFP